MDKKTKKKFLEHSDGQEDDDEVPLTPSANSVYTKTKKKFLEHSDGQEDDEEVPLTPSANSVYTIIAADRHTLLISPVPRTT